MAKAALIVRRPDGEVLYDTSKSIYGLIKAGPVVYAGTWNRLQPNGASSFWVDQVYKFEVENAISPIVFVYGESGKPYQSQEGNKQVFYFAGPAANARVYCFDIMQPIFTGPALKTRDSNGEFTFNSLQFPLNVKGTSEPPPQQPLGNGFIRPYNPSTREGILTNLDTRPLAGSLYVESKKIIDPTKKYAAHIPWSRGAEWFGSFDEGGGHVGRYRGSAEEGCYGTDGGISHIFWTAPETTFGNVFGNTWGWFNLSGERLPLCSYIDIAEYPYPFDPSQ